MSALRDDAASVAIPPRALRKHFVILRHRPTKTPKIAAPSTWPPDEGNMNGWGGLLFAR
jgi:hypothetical protein